MIDVPVLKEELTKLLTKLNEIDLIPKLFVDSKATFTGLEFDADGVTFKSEYCHCGNCGTESYSFDVKWDEVNQPIEYFQKKYAKEIEDRRIWAENQKQKEIRQKEIDERKKLEELKRKYEGANAS